MSKTYELVYGDTSRVMEVELDVNGSALETKPTSAVLRLEMDSSGTDIEELTLTYVEGDVWKYDWGAAGAFDAFANVTKVYQGKIHATFADGEELQFPTKGKIGIAMEKRVGV